MLLEGDAVDVAGFNGWRFVGFVHLKYLNKSQYDDFAQ